MKISKRNRVNFLKNTRFTRGELATLDCLYGVLPQQGSTQIDLRTSCTTRVQMNESLNLFETTSLSAGRYFNYN